MGTIASRSVVAGVSTLAGLAAGIITNLITQKFSWGLAAGLVVAAVAMVVGQVRLSSAPPPDRVVASNLGSVAAGGSADAEFDITTQGSAPAAGGASTGDVEAAGPGSIAAGKNIAGKIRIRAKE